MAGDRIFKHSYIFIYIATGVNILTLFVPVVMLHLWMLCGNHICPLCLQVVMGILR
jgi:hypothetical protein